MKNGKALFFHILCILALFLFIPIGLFGVEGFDFGESEEPEGQEGQEQEGEPFSLCGTIRLKGAYQLDEPYRFVDLSPTLYVVFDYHGDPDQVYFEVNLRYNGAYRIESDPVGTVDEYEFQGVIRELFWRRPFGPVTLTAGKVITGWNVVDMLPVTDIISLRDRTRDYFEDPVDTVLGQLSLVTDFYTSWGMLNLVIVPYPLVNLVPARDHPYSILPGYSIPDYSIEDNTALRIPGFAGRLNLSFSLGELSVITGRLYNLDPIVQGELTSGGYLEFNACYDSYWFSGSTLSMATGPLLWKAEAVYNFYRPRQRIIGGIPAGIQYCDGFQFAAGLDFNAGLFGTLTAEVNGEIIIGGDDNLLVDENTFSSAYSWKVNFLNDRIFLNTAIMFPAAWQNIIARVGFIWNIVDDLSVSLKYTGFFIGSEDEPYARLDNYDRVDLSLSYAFSFY